MSMFKIFVGGTLGFMWGGPLGAVAGAALGNFLSRDEYEREYSNYERTSEDEMQSVFFTCVLSLCGKIAKADGVVTKEEDDKVYKFIEQFISGDQQMREFATQVYEESKNSPHSHLEFAEQFYSVFGAELQMQETIIEALFSVALADGNFHPAEEKIILETAEVFGFTQDRYDRIRSLYVKELTHEYTVLGLRPGAPFSEVKKQYRKMASEYHPDKVIAKGMPQQFVELANKKFAEINQAYEKIKAHTGN